MTFEIACEKIFASAKKRFDYISYEDEFIDFFGTEKGSLIASNLVTEVMIGLANGKTIDEIATALNMQMMAAGIKTDVAVQCKTIDEATKKEQGAFTRLRVYDQMGMNTDEAYAEVKKDLFAGYAHPTEEERATIEKECLSLIIESAKKSIPCFDECKKSEMTKRPAKAERRMDTIVRVSLGFFSAVENVELEQIRDYLVAMMVKGTEPSWLMDFLQEAKSSVCKELCAMNAMNIGWEMKMSVDKIAQEVKYRLDH